MKVNINKTKVIISGECQKPVQNLQDGSVVYVAVIQYSVLVVRSGYTRSVVV